MINQLKKFDLKFIGNSNRILAGVDEAGRGPLAGPVVAASVIFDKDTNILGVNDSKALKESMRESLYDEITCKSISFGIGIIDNLEIDEINILQASLKAMKIAVNNMNIPPDIILIDGNKSFFI